jgi:hypothetical protein
MANVMNPNGDEGDCHIRKKGEKGEVKYFFNHVLIYSIYSPFASL